jgi:AraC-like DNA-binding protein
MASLTLSWIQLAAAVGALQGLFLTAVVAAQRSNRTANRILAVLMAALTVYLASGVYYASGLFRAYPHFFGISYHMPWIFGPLIYLYARGATDRAWRVRRRHLIHFIPVAISLALTARFYFMSGAEKVALYDRWVIGGVPAGIKLIDPWKYVSGIGYTIATALYLRRHRYQVEQSYSNTARVNLRWLMWLAAGTGAVWVLAASLKLSRVSTHIRDEHISLAIAILVYAIGYRGLRQTEVFRHETQEYPVVTPRDVSVPVHVDVEPSVQPRYERSGLTETEAAGLATALRALMDTKQPWRDSELTLSDLASQLDTSPHKLSEVLNSQIGQTFYDFVNSFRVREVQRRIKEGDARALKMLALAMDAGFASKSTFNQAFKKHAQQTPSEFRQAVGA